MFCGLCCSAELACEPSKYGIGNNTVERLQQALQRARKERQGLIGNVPDIDAKKEAAAQSSPPSPSGTVPVTKPASSPTTLGFRVAGVPPNPIEYTSSRVVKLDDAHMEANRVIAGQSGDERVEAYRQLRTQVLHTLDRNNWNTLAITSPMKNAGKTLTAINLAISLAKEVNHSVLLVDLDLSHPDVHATLGVEVEYGLIDILEGRASFEQALFNPGMQRLTVLPCRPTEQYSSELLSSPDMSALLKEIKSRYESRIIIFDLPPLLRNDDALKFTPYVEATLMVVEAGETTPEELERSTHLMKNSLLYTSPSPRDRTRHRMPSSA